MRFQRGAVRHVNNMRGDIVDGGRPIVATQRNDRRARHAVIGRRVGERLRRRPAEQPLEDRRRLFRRCLDNGAVNLGAAAESPGSLRTRLLRRQCAGLRDLIAARRRRGRLRRFRIRRSGLHERSGRKAKRKARIDQRNVVVNGCRHPRGCGQSPRQLCVGVRNNRRVYMATRRRRQRPPHFGGLFIAGQTKIRAGDIVPNNQTAGQRETPQSRAAEYSLRPRPFR